MPLDMTCKNTLFLAIALFKKLRESAETETIKVLSYNLHELLLAAPARPRVVMGLCQEIRMGCKVAMIDATGKLLETTTIYLHEPCKDWNRSLATLENLDVKRRRISLTMKLNDVPSLNTRTSSESSD